MTGIRRTKVKETDKRVKLMNEVLSGIRVIKYYAWEFAFTQKINIIRGRELELLKVRPYWPTWKCCLWPCWSSHPGT